MSKIQTVPLSCLVPDPHNPRQQYDESELQALATNIKQQGQLVPLITFLQSEKNLQIVDGHRRYFAAKQIGIETLNAIILSERPTEAKLRLTQLSIDVHRQNYTLLERSDLYASIMQETNCSVSELADSVGVLQPMVSKIKSLQKLTPEAKALVQNNGLDIEDAYKISQEPDGAKQVELAHQAASMSREEFRQHTKSTSTKSRPKPEQVKFPMPTGNILTLTGSELTLASVIEVMSDCVRELKRGLTQNLDIKTIQSVFRDKAKSSSS